MASSRNRRGQTSLVFCACWALGLLGCQLVFGEYKAGHADGAGAAQTGGTAVAGGGASAGGEVAGAPGGTAGAASSSGGAAPTGGSGGYCSGTPPYTCSGALLQACTNGVWSTIDTCARPGLCQPALGVCDACADGDRACTGSVLGVCNADRTGFTTIDTCQAPLYCDPTADYCVACAANQARCNGDYLDVCNADRTAWILEARSCGGLGCQDVGGTADYCNDCTADNPSVCASANVLRSCISGKWKATQCPNGCVDATETTPAACY